MGPSLEELKTAGYKPADAWWTVFLADPIAIRMLWLLVRVRPTTSPNTVTTLSLLFGLTSALAFAGGRVVLGAVLYQVSFVLDCVDGKLARFQRRSSPFGSFYDGLVNTTVYVAALMGVAWWLTGQGDPLGVVGAVLLVALRALSLQANVGLGSMTASTGWSAMYRKPDDSWLTRHRLLPPFTFPDKHALLFLAGPLLGLTTVMIGVNLFLEAALVVLKLRRARGLDAATTDAAPAAP